MIFRKIFDWMIVIVGLFVRNGDASVLRQTGREDLSEFHVPIRFGNSSEPLNLLVDINAAGAWIFADKSNKLFSFKDLCKASNFNATYTKDIDGFEATFDGYNFEEQIIVGKNTHSISEKLMVKTDIGFVFRSTLNDTSKLKSGIFGLGSVVENTEFEQRQFTIATSRNTHKTHLIFGSTHLEQHCTQSLLNESVIQQQKTLKWMFQLKNVTLNDESTTSNSQIALISSLNPSIVGPKSFVDKIYRELDAQKSEDSLWPTVKCSAILNGPDLVFYSENVLHRIPSSVYVGKRGQTCHLLILPSDQNDKWILGHPFFAGRCLTFDYSQKLIKFSDSF